MRLQFRRFELKLAHEWTIASGLGPAGTGGTYTYEVVFVELRDKDGVAGLGEAAPAARYDENSDSTVAFLERIAASQLSFADVDGGMRYLETLAPGHFAAKAAVNIALLDGAARRAAKPIYDYLGLGFRENHHVTSLSIGMDRPEVIRQKVLEAAPYPVLKLKVGSPHDRQNLAALRQVAPTKTVRVDGNEAWKSKEEALRQLEWLAADKRIQFIEQPMPATAPLADLVWLKQRSPLPIMADESYLCAADIGRCAQAYHAVNVKLVKAGGISAGYAALKAARQAGLKTMLGCMIESSILISAAAQLAELTDYLDLDGNLLITNDPYEGATAEQGLVSFAKAVEPHGLRVRARSAPGQLRV
jgi:L-alanine-DL-glutamate epimerase-like enolase superfamily enzyme